MQNTVRNLLIIKRIEEFDKRYFFSALLLLQLIISVLDYVTGPLIPFTVFYIIPIITSAFFLNRNCTITLITLAIFSWMLNLMQLHAANRMYVLSFHFFLNIVLFSSFAYLISNLRSLMMSLRSQATVDLLSGALTRRYFNEISQTELSRCCRYHYPVSIAYIDLDNFKSVNDTLGHHIGDKILVTTAAAIKANLREGDLFGRLGGDEFAIFLINTDREEMEEVMHRMRDNLMKAISAFKTNVTYSIGAVTYQSEKQITIAELLQIADEAMYQSKKPQRIRLSLRQFKLLYKCLLWVDSRHSKLLQPIKIY